MRSRTRFLIAALSILAGLVAGLSSGERAAAQLGEADGAQAIELDEYAFNPSVIAAAPGTLRLHLANTGLRRHNMVVLVDGVELESPHVRPGNTVVWDVPLDRAGTYLFWCNEYRHLEKGMVGTVAVE